MDELFAPPGNAWRPVSPQLQRMRRTVLSVVTAVLLLGVVVAGVLLSWSAMLTVGTAVAVLVLGGYLWWVVGRNARYWAYAERDDDLYIRHGAFFRELVAVPYGRMQYVDITAGPIEQMYGIATVHLHTASPRTNARIPGLPADEAARLRDRLTELGESQAAGL